VRPRFQFWQLAVPLLLLCGAGIGIWQWRKASRFSGAGRLMQSLPLDGAVKLYIDFDQLRASGLLDLLAGSKSVEEADYRKFVEDTGFDYRTDLSGVAAAFVRGDIYFAIRGHFDWKRLSAYARAQQGHCGDTICSMPASQPNRFVSFYPLASSVMALAVSGEDQGVNRIAPLESPASSAIPSAPVWVSAPSFVFTNLKGLPAGSSVLSPLADAQEAVFRVQAAPSAGFELVMDAKCATPAIATDVAKRFARTTELLSNMLQRDHITPNPADLSGVLVAGRFESKDSHMTGTWAIDRRFFEALVSGKIQ
jgi:hypothetical protein